jgi:hypothetical protein
MSAAKLTTITNNRRTDAQRCAHVTPGNQPFKIMPLQPAARAGAVLPTMVVRSAAARARLRTIFLRALAAGMVEASPSYNSIKSAN